MVSFPYLHRPEASIPLVTLCTLSHPGRTPQVLLVQHTVALTILLVGSPVHPLVHTSFPATMVLFYTSFRH